MRLHSPLHMKYIEKGATIQNIWGWQVATAYDGTHTEYLRVRQGVGMSDYPMSHVAVRGRGATEFLQNNVSRDISRMTDGKILYCLILGPRANILEDVTVYRLGEQFYLINGQLINTTLLSTTDPFKGKGPRKWFSDRQQGEEVDLHHVGFTVISVQGPHAAKVMNKIADVADLRYFCCKTVRLGDIPAIVSRTGFTGEVGYEILVWPESALDVWERIESAGREWNIGPYGFNATKILGIEKGCLEAPDFFPGSTPYEVGLMAFVDLAKSDFVGREALLRRAAQPPKNRLAGLEADPGTEIASLEGGTVLLDNVPVGKVTACAYSPGYGIWIGRCWISSAIQLPAPAIVALPTNERCPVRLIDTYRWYDPEGRLLRTGTGQ